MKPFVLSLLLAAGTATPAFADDKPAAAAPAAGTPAPDAGAAKKVPRSKQMDINSASEDDLKTLPGVTDDVAKKIIAGRPYTGKDQLLKQNIVDKDEYAKIRNLIHATQPKAIGGQGAPEQHTTPGPATTTPPKK
jgi:competence protein ComEA